MFQGSLLEKGFCYARQVVISFFLRCTGIGILDECPGFSDFVGSTATCCTNHISAQWLRIRLSLGAVRLHS
jgi:hypothetical protein